LAFGGAASKSSGFAAVGCIIGAALLAGCAMGPPVEVVPNAGLPVPGPPRDTPVPADGARLLTAAPNGARLDYRLIDGQPAVFVLGPIFQSGLSVPCRIGHLAGARVSSDSPTDYAFCRRGDRWYQMPPVVVSGY
jgi:hypothetical protein